MTPQEFVKKANVEVVKSNDTNVGNFAEFLNTSQENNAGKLMSQNLNNIVAGIVETTELRYTNFIAEVGPIARPDDVLAFVRQTKPRGIDGNYDVREISGYHGRFQKGATHTNAYGFQTAVNINKKSWTFVEFTVVVKNKKKVVARLYKDKMLLQGGFVDNDPETPLKVARFIANKYLAQNSADLRVKFASIDGVLQVRGIISPSRLSETLRQNGTPHEFNPSTKASDVRKIKYNGETIDSVTIQGFITLKRKSLKELQQAYKVALKFVERMKARGLITPTQNFAQRKEVMSSPQRTKVQLPRVSKLKNVLLNNKLCTEYSLARLKQICKAMGIFIKKTWTKDDMCQAIFEKSVNRVNNVMARTRGINNAYIKELIELNYGSSFKRGRNVTEDLRLVKMRMNNLKTNKKGVPFRGGVKKLVKEVVQQRKLNAYLANYKSNLHPVIRQRVKTISKRAINKEAQKLKNLTPNELNVVKNKNIHPNVNVKTYLRQRKLLLNYIRAVVRPGRMNSVRRDTTAWLNGLNKSRNNDDVKRKLLQVIRTYDDPTMNMKLMEGLYARRTRPS